MASGVKVSKMNFELNPRGNLWFNDESTFGHKLLSKMGWSKGKGLGKNEDGIKENIKISKKDSNSGVGWKNDEIPIAIGCLEYENILQNLQKQFKNNQEKSSTDERFEKSLEQRSRSARNHLHYQKFVRVKDLNRYSEKDMKSIFLEKPPKPVREHPSEVPNQTPTFNSQLSVNDYFAMKMQRKKEEVASSNITAENNIPPEPQQPNGTHSRKRKFVSENADIETVEKSKKKKTLNDEMSKNKLMVDESTESEECSKKKKRKKKSKKNKLHLQHLKSCLKSRTDYDLEKIRNVSFNEQVSYKILDTSLELCEEINDLTNHDHLTMHEAASAVEEFPVLSDSDGESENSTSNDNSNKSMKNEEDPHTNEDNNFTEEGGDSSNEEESGADEQLPQCLNLPKSSGSNFNFWLESQRQASKMKLYKEMVKKLKKNKILRSTNLFDIKGYGNWGL